MKKKHFYSNLISIEQMHVEFGSLDLSKEERGHLLTLVHENLHLKILDTVFSHLTTNEKETFLSHLEDDDHDKTWEFLKEKIEDIEEKIVASAEELLKEFQHDIAKVKKRTS